MKAICFTFLTLLLNAAAAPLPPLTIPEGVGVNIHFTSGHERDLDLIAAGGFKFVRMDFGWEGTERVRNEFNWTAYDELTANLEKRGLSAIYILDYSNSLYEETVVSKNPIDGHEQRSTASPQHPESVAAFARWAAAAARHFRGRSIIWEIWNEPNISFWKPKPDVQQYNTLALAACRAIREAHPSALIAGPATSEIPMAFLEDVLKSGLLNWLDAVSVHPYRSYRKSPETALEEYARLRTLIERYAPTPEKKKMPILSGEWGYATHTKGVSLQTQADYLVRQQLINLLAGIPISIWYDWKNDGTDPAEREHNFGVVTGDLEPKPAYIALQTMVSELSGCKVGHRLETQSSDDYLLLCRNAGGSQKIAAWTLLPASRVTLEFAEPVGPIRIVSKEGKILEPQWRGPRLLLEISSAPCYVTLGSATIQSVRPEP